MQANDEVRREVSTWENLRTPPEKSLKLVLSIYIYIYIIFIYIYSYKAFKNTGQTDHCIRTLMYIYIYISVCICKEQME